MRPESQNFTITRRMALCVASALIVATSVEARGAKSRPPEPVTTIRVVTSAVSPDGHGILPTPEERLNEQIRVSRTGASRGAILPDSTHARPDASPPALAGSNGLPWTSEPFLLGGFLIGLALIATSFWVGRRQAGAKNPKPEVVARQAPRGTGLVRSMLLRRGVNAPHVVAPAPAPVTKQVVDEGVTPWWAELPRARHDLFTPARAESTPAAPAPAPAPDSAPEPAPDEARLLELESDVAADRVRLGAVGQRLDLIEGSMLELVRSVEQLAVRIESRPEPKPRPLLAPKPQPPAPDPTERPHLGPWEDPSLALPPQNPRVRPEPFFARVAAERAERRSLEQTPQPQHEPEAPAKPTVDAPPLPAPATARPSLPDLSKTRELVLSLARRGWDRDRISREAQVPRGDVSLILKTAPAARIGAAESEGGGR